LRKLATMTVSATATTSAAGQVLNFSSAQVQAMAQLPGVARVTGLRTVPMQLNPALPSVMLVARTIDDPAKDLPLVGSPVAAASGVPVDAVPLFVSEAVVDLYGAQPGQLFIPNLPLAQQNIAQAATPSIATPTYYVAGVWRDYARQFGAIAIDQRAYVRITGDAKVNDLAVWPSSGANPREVQERIRTYVASQFAANAGAVAK
jgi:putative ABC transport system permease protein